MEAHGKPDLQPPTNTSDSTPVYTLRHNLDTNTILIGKKLDCLVSMMGFNTKLRTNLIPKLNLISSNSKFLYKPVNFSSLIHFGVILTYEHLPESGYKEQKYYKGSLHKVPCLVSDYRLMLLTLPFFLIILMPAMWSIESLYH